SGGARIDFASTTNLAHTREASTVWAVHHLLHFPSHASAHNAVAGTREGGDLGVELDTGTAPRCGLSSSCLPRCQGGSGQRSLSCLPMRGPRPPPPPNLLVVGETRLRHS